MEILKEINKLKETINILKGQLYTTSEFETNLIRSVISEKEDEIESLKRTLEVQKDKVC